MNPIRAALQNRAVVFVLSAFAVLLGLRALLTMPRREDPRITIRTGLVLAQYPGATARQAEEQVTRKIEERLFRHAEVRKRKTFSTSRDGSVVVNVELEDALEARRSALRVAADRERQGLVLAAFRADADATEAASEAEAISASLQARIARAELARVVGDALRPERPAGHTTGEF